MKLRQRLGLALGALTLTGVAVGASIKNNQEVEIDIEMINTETTNRLDDHLNNNSGEAAEESPSNSRQTQSIEQERERVSEQRSESTTADHDPSTFMFEGEFLREVEVTVLEHIRSNTPESIYDEITEEDFQNLLYETTNTEILNYALDQDPDNMRYFISSISSIPAEIIDRLYYMTETNDEDRKRLLREEECPTNILEEAAEAAIQIIYDSNSGIDEKHNALAIIEIIASNENTPSQYLEIFFEIATTMSFIRLHEENGELISENSCHFLLLHLSHNQHLHIADQVLQYIIINSDEIPEFVVHMTGLNYLRYHQYLLPTVAQHYPIAEIRAMAEGRLY